MRNMFAHLKTEHLKNIMSIQERKYGKILNIVQKKINIVQKNLKYSAEKYKHCAEKYNHCAEKS